MTEGGTLKVTADTKKATDGKLDLRVLELPELEAQARRWTRFLKRSRTPQQD